MQIAPYWVWRFVNLSPAYANWQYVGNASTLNPGEGFSMKGTSGTDGLVADADGVSNKVSSAQRYDFRGRPNDGDISVAVSAGNFTFVGNPYSSAVNLNQYLVENRGDSYDGTGAVSVGGNTKVIDGTAYFWEHSKSANTHLLVGYVGGYGTYVANGANIGTPGTWVSATWNTFDGSGNQISTGASTGSNFKRQFSPIGQGFMVNGFAAGSSVMRNKYRVFVREGVSNESTFEKTSNVNINPENLSSQEVWNDIPNMAGIDYTQISKLPVPQIKLQTILNNQMSIEVAMAFNPNTTDDYDLGYDGVSPDTNSPNVIYFGQANNTKKCVITTLPFASDKRIPIAFKCAAQSTFKVKVSEIINFYDSENVFIYDKDTGIYHDIKNGDFNVTLSAGENNTRFEVTFKNFDVLANEDFNLGVTSFEVFQNNNNSMLTIVNNLNKEVLNCSVYDVTGKLVIAKKNLGTNNRIELPTNTLSNGVYIVKLNTADNISIEKKVIVAN